MKFSYDITDLNIENEINNDTIKEIYKIIIDSLEKEGIDKSSYKLLALKLNNYCHLFLEALDESFPKEYQVWAFNRINLYLWSQIEDEEIKVLFMGGIAGKTSIINRLIGRQDPTYTTPTMLPSLFSKNISIDNKNYILNLWDIPSQEKFPSTTKYIVKDANMILKIISKMI